MTEIAQFYFGLIGAAKVADARLHVLLHVQQILLCAFLCLLVFVVEVSTYSRDQNKEGRS